MTFSYLESLDANESFFFFFFFIGNHLRKDFDNCLAQKKGMV